MSLCENKKKFSVSFHDVHLYSQPVLYDQRLLRLKVVLHRATGRFEVSNEYSKVASGFINAHLLVENTKTFLKESNESKGPLELTEAELYELLSERDYSYSGEFCSIHKANIPLTEALLKWNNNWVTLIDGMLQINALRESHGGISYPVYIRQLIIDLKEHYNNKIIKMDGKSLMQMNIIKLHELSRCGGVSMQNIRFHHLPKCIRNTLKALPLSLHTYDELSKGTCNEDYTIKMDRKLAIECIGDINTLHWIKNMNNNELNNNGIYVKVHYAGLNLSDLKRATGMGISNLDDNNFGMEFSGISKSGDRIMGLSNGGACSTNVVVQPDFIWPIPAHWSLEDAATVPFAYTLAFYCLGIKLDLKRNSSILVHGGAGALGQAVISIALAHKCQVFTTVCSNLKKRLLCKLYPDLNEKNIGNSRDLSFGDMVLNATNGKGCDIVISNVRGELKNISLNCSGLNGYTFDLSQNLNTENYCYGMYKMTKQRSYVVLDVSSIFNLTDSEERQKLRTLMIEGVSCGYVKPLTRTTFSANEAPKAFRYLTESHRHGRVILRVKETMIDPREPRIFYSSDLCQVLFSDGSKLAMQVADGLIRGGARKIYYHVPVLDSSDRLKIGSWKKLGVDVKVSCDIMKNKNSVQSVIIEAENFGVIESIFVFMTEDNCISKSEQMVSSLTSIDSVSRSLCPVLMYFILITTADQCNIGQMICDSRQNDGFPATLLNLEKSNVKPNWDIDILEALEYLRPTSCTAPIDQQNINNALSLLQQITILMDLKVSDVDMYVTLRELGINDTQCQVINAFLRDTHNVFLTDDEILSLNINRINELEQFITEPYFKDLKGLENFFSYVDQNELLATTEIVPMSTWAHEVISKDDEFDVSQTYLCILPGMEGLHERFRQLCERLKVPALVLQPGLDTAYETITEMAERFAKILLNKITLKDNFYLLGYEMGVTIVLEIATILEKHGLQGTIFCIGCTPNDLKDVVNRELKDFETEGQLQNAIVQNTFKIVLKEDSSVIENNLNIASTWTEKMEICVQRTLGRVALSAEYVAAVMEVALARIKQIRSYSCSVGRLRSKLVLLRSLPASRLSEHEMQQYSQKPICVHDLGSRLPYAAQDMRCSAIINKYLSTEILDTFNKKNLCEVYVNDSATRFAVL